MAAHLDLEEQEQLDQLRHFWRRWGAAITWVLIAAFAALAAWNGYQYWQRRQAAQASLLFDEVERSAQAGDTERLQRAFGDLRDKYGRTAYAPQGALVTAKTLLEKGKTDAARSALAWAAEKSGDEGLKAVARLRLSAVALEAKAYDEALRQLDAPFPHAFTALVDDRRGDVLLAQDKRADAAAAYRRAWQGLEDAGDYRRVVEAKLNALGVDPNAAAAGGTPAPAAKPAG